MMDCIRCGNEIPEARLKALPETELCIGCSEAVGGDFIVTATYERTNKPGSMKVNYGSLTVVKRRRQIVPLPNKKVHSQKE